jgi:hypothetical protein
VFKHRKTTLVSRCQPPAIRFRESAYSEPCIEGSLASSLECLAGVAARIGVSSSS